MYYYIFLLPDSHPNYGSKQSAPVNLGDYVHVYRGTLDKNEFSEKEEMLDRIYETLNIAHPRDYYSRSLSMGDIVMLGDGEVREWYMVARFGFEKLEEDEIN